MSQTQAGAGRRRAHQPRLPLSGKLIGGAIALLIVLVVVVASCGGGDEADRSGETTQAAVFDPAPAGSGENEPASDDLSADAAGSSSTTSTNGSAGEPSSAPFTPIDVTGPHLEAGSDGDRVEQLQEALSALGIDPGPIDGIFGERTKAAVGAFQKAQGIAETGLADEETIRAINTAMQEQG